MATTLERAVQGAQLNVDDLLEKGRQAAGLSDYGDTWFVEPLTQLVTFINTESGLVSADAPPVQLIINNLADRLRLVEYLRKHPETRDEKIEVAGFIIGWPRGGSTLLQRLLNASPQLTSTYWWELLNPFPLADEKPGDYSKRQQMALDAAEAMYTAWPRLRNMHPLKPLDADEEVILFDRTFMSLMWPQYFYIPSYMSWLQQQDQSKAYDELKLWLKVLSHQQPERRGKKWILKTPQHLLGGGLRWALESMPEAKAIMTHRSLQNVATSYSSMTETTLGGWSATLDLKKIGRDSIKLFGQSVDHLRDVRAGGALEDRFIDVQFKDTVERPMEVFRSVMEQMGLTVTDADMAAAATWMAANGRETHPPHKYSPEDFGMTGDEIDGLFAEYHATYVK